MGLLNVIKLANDYNQAKKLLKGKKVNAIKVRDAIDRIHDYIEELKSAKDKIDTLIVKAKERIRKLSELLKVRKVGK